MFYSITALRSLGSQEKIWTQGEKSRGIWIAADVTFQTSWPVKVSVRTKENQKIYLKRRKSIFIVLFHRWYFYSLLVSEHKVSTVLTKAMFNFIFECMNDNQRINNIIINTIILRVL